MAQPRKTVNVEYLRQYANEQLLRTDDDATREFKSGVCTMIERVLNTSNNYKGFYFLNGCPRVFEEDYFSRHYM